jgi:hypothetical protein
MNMRKLLTGTAITTGLLMAGALPAAATNVPLGGYSGPLQLNFDNYESFLTSTGTVTSTPAVGDQNFGIFTVFNITTQTALKLPVWSANQNGDVLVGVFDGIKVTSVSGPVSGETTTNTGGVFQLYLVPTSKFLAAGGDQGIAGYANAGCAIGTLCYNGITNVVGGGLVLTMSLVNGGVAPGVSLEATVNATTNPPTGSASFDGLLSDTTQFAANVSGKDSFCPNIKASGCAGADNSTFALASQDPIVGQAIPEPGSLALIGTALLGFAGFGWRSKRKRG